MPKRNVTITLLQAHFDEGSNYTIENIINSSFQNLSEVRDRVVQIDLMSWHLFAHVEHCQSSNGTFVRVLEFENGAIGVIDMDNADGTNIVEAFVHPDNKDFLKREIVLLVLDNKILACNLTNKSGALSGSVLAIGEKAGVLVENTKMRISDVPNTLTVAQVRNIGVKKIELNVTDYIQNIELPDANLRKRDVMWKLFGNVSGGSVLRKRAATRAKITLTSGRFAKEEIRQDQFLTNLGADLMDEEDDHEYFLVLTDGSKVSNKNLRKSKSYKLNAHANSFDYDAAKQALLEYSRSALQAEL